MESLTFNNICKELLNIDKMGIDGEKTLDFFLNCFCYGKLPLKVRPQNFQKMFSRTFGKNGAIQHTELKNEHGRFGELVENFDFNRCSSNIYNFVKKNKIIGFQDNCLKLKDQLTPSMIGFDDEKNQYIANAIHTAFEISEYDGVMLAMLVSLYPCNLDRKLPTKQDHSDRLVCAIEKYTKSLLNKGIKLKHSSDPIMVYFRSASKKITDSAYDNCGRLIPPSLSKEYGQIKEMTLSCTYEDNNSEKAEYTLEQIVAKYPAKNIMAVGPGGCGKTYSLINLAKELLDDNRSKVIPLYIELKELNNSKESLVDYIYKLISGNSSLKTDKVKTDMSEWLVQNKDVSLLFLLDGFNEITSDDFQIRITQEICRLIKNYGCIRFLITSRYDMTDIFYRGGANISKSFISYSVKELSDKVVMEYIDKLFANDPNLPVIRQNALINKKNKNDKNKKNNKNEKNEENNNEAVKTFLKNPMALVMYCLIKKDPNIIQKPRHNNCQTLGELIDNYIALIKLSSEGNKKLIHENDMAEQLFQYIGFQMNNLGLFSLPTTKLNGLIDNPRIDVLNKLKNNSFIKDVTKYELKNRIEFIHQNYRDYFAAKFLESILNSGNVKKINKYFGEQAMSQEVKKLLGEILEEYRFKDTYKNDKDNKSKTDDKDSVIQSQLKGGNKNLSAPAISQLISTAADARGDDMSSFDFSDLDLSSTSLNGIKLYKNLKECAKFSGSLITKYTLNAHGQPGAVFSMLWVKKRYLLSFSKLGFFCFDMQIRKHYRIADYTENAVRASISLQNEYILTGDDSGRITLWKYKFREKNDFQLSAICSIEIKSGLRAVKILDMIEFGGKIYASGEGGSVHSFTVKEIYKKPQILDCQEERIFNAKAGNTSLCRVTTSACSLYCSFERTIMKRTRNNDEFSIYQEIESGEIIDIAAVDFGLGESILVNIEDKDRSDLTFSQILSFKNGKQHRVTERRHHSSGRVGFKGWNSFSESYENTIFITALIEDAPRTPGLLKINVDDKGILSGSDYNGNNHSMSVNCAICFEHGERGYIATGSTERSIEIMSTETDAGTLMYHLNGHDNGIHYIDVISNTVIYTAHYSGEVSRWEFIDNKWLCREVYAPHTFWVWECRRVQVGENSYVVSCSYDNTLSIIDVQTGEKIITITEPNGRVLSFGFLSYNVILTGYNNAEGKTILRIFEIDYTQKSYRYSIEFNILNTKGFELRSIHTFRRSDQRNSLLLCTNNKNHGCVFGFTMNPVVNSQVLALDTIRDISEKDKQVVIRCIDDKKINNRKLLACGGDYKDKSVKNAFYATVWHQDNINLSVSIFEPEGDGCSALRLYEYRNEPYLIAGDYNGIISIYKINFNERGYKLVYSCGSLNDKILCIQCQGSVAFFSTLGGRVYSLSVDTAIRTKDSGKKPTELFRTVSGMRCCYVDFTTIDENSNLDKEFRKIICHYGKVDEL